MMNAYDIELAYAYCKGTLSTVQRKKIGERRKSEPDIDQLIKDIEDLFKHHNEADVHNIIQSWKISRINAYVPSQDSEAQVKKASSAENNSENDNPSVDIQTQQGTIRRYLIIALIVLILIALVLILT